MDTRKLVALLIVLFFPALVCGGFATDAGKHPAFFVVLVKLPFLSGQAFSIHFQTTGSILLMEHFASLMRIAENPFLLTHQQENQLCSLNH